MPFLLEGKDGGICMANGHCVENLVRVFLQGLHKNVLCKALLSVFLLLSVFIKKDGRVKGQNNIRIREDGKGEDIRVFGSEKVTTENF